MEKTVRPEHPSGPGCERRSGRSQLSGGLHGVLLGLLLTLTVVCSSCYQPHPDLVILPSPQTAEVAPDPGEEPRCLRYSGCERVCRRAAAGDLEARKLCDAWLKKIDHARENRQDIDLGDHVADGPALDSEQVFSRGLRVLVLIETETGFGSGFAISNRGLIVTNVHVLAGASKARVRLMDGSERRVLGVEAFDALNDVMLLRVEGVTRPATMTPHDRVVLAETVYALGNPLGLQATISKGLVSGVRKLENGRRVIQISAPISPGSSGGPIFNRFGQVIGIATFVIRGGENIGFGVPVRVVKRLLNSRKPISLARFAKETAAQTPRTHKVPRYSTDLLAGCKAETVDKIGRLAGATLRVAASLLERDEYRAAAQIFEGAAAELERDHAASCPGPSKALANALGTAHGNHSERAKALRTSFEGLLDLVARWKHESKPK